MTTRYTSKISLGLWIPVFTAWCGVIALMIIQRVWVMVPLMLLGAAFSAYCTFTIRYVIDDGNLTITWAFWKQIVKIDSIRKIKETNNPLSSPAASFDRLEILYNKYDTVMISPNDKESFIHQLTAINTNIQVQSKRKK
ncbi:PH domain-containing protein [Filimonas effusa]|uniref:Uncharacterized protein YyaB-like PH domain-containing protein n=1 Tax=Filimonas effusa TaxID=2508721 RepID=A0A4Q1D0I1_9BACT|nr:PH domain-containing protein [Filimonas effusa]RXK80734.1 hypothetical protein ESB13_21450 [Filimonas effusa]